jgi:hypothetical protein
MTVSPPGYTQATTDGPRTADREASWDSTQFDFDAVFDQTCAASLVRLIGES